MATHTEGASPLLVEHVERAPRELIRHVAQHGPSGPPSRSPAAED